MLQLPLHAALIASLSLAIVGPIAEAKIRTPDFLPEPISEYTVEAAAVLSPLAVRARVLDARPYGQPRDGFDQFRVVIDVEEAFSASAPPSRITFAAYRITEDAPIRQRDIGSELLLFLRPAQLGEQERRDCDGCGWELNNDTSINPFINLSRPISDRVVGQDLELLSDPTAILAAVRSVSGWKKDHYVVQVRLACDRLVGLLDDGALLQRARRWSVSADPDRRSASIDILQPLEADEDSETRLLELLKDPYIEPLSACCQNFCPWSERRYFIRQRAWEALQARNTGNLPPMPQLAVDPGFYRSAISLWRLIAGAGLLSTVGIGFLLFSRWDPLHKAWITSATFAIVILALAALSQFWLIDVTESRNNVEVRSITFERGKLIYWQYLSTPGNPIPGGFFWGIFRENGGLRNWHDTASPIEDWLFELSPNVVRTVPLWPSALLPLAPAAYGLYLLRLRRTRLRTGCCAFCGYDLRASSGCCTECGRPVGARADKQVTVS